MNKNKVALEREILASIPRTLALLDKNPYSKNFGSFDRKFWHYKIIDFSSGMQQELIYPLAYVWNTQFEGNSYYKNKRIEQFIKGAFKKCASISHADGSVDDYFPHERALGATSYMLAAMTDTARLTNLHDTDDLQAMTKIGGFIADFQEAGTLSNHTAIATFALFNLYLLNGDEKWKQTANNLLEKLLASQSKEGWFPEYEGCDLGYQTVTIEFLARAYRAGFHHPELRPALERAISFVRQFLHPDGSFGGEYGSRNTYNFYIGGFALMQADNPDAQEFIFSFFKGMENGCQNYLVDDGVFQHMLSSYAVALSDGSLEGKSWQPEYAIKPTVEIYQEAKLFIAKTGTLSVFGNLTKGGVFKVFDGDSLIASDTGYILELSNGKIYCQNKAGSSNDESHDLTIQIRGKLKPFRIKSLTRIHMIGLRVLSLIFGRFTAYSHIIRRLMQAILIYDKDVSDISFFRQIEVSEHSIRLTEEITNNSGFSIKQMHRTTDCTNMHVVTSNSFQQANILDWEKVDPTDNVYHFNRVYNGNAESL